jgi:quinol monooxygenase YgiN/predicted ester cyclase
MHVRINMLSGDPAQLDEAVRYLDATARSDVEAEPGSRGLALLTNASLGTCIIASYWDSVNAMTASEQAVQVARKQITEMMKGTLTVEQYEVPVFVRRSRPQAGAGVRMVRIECSPLSVDAVIDEFRNHGVPSVMEMRGLCSAQLLTDRSTGRCIVVAAWEDADAMAASRADGARLRANLIDVTHAQVRSVEEYRLEFTTVREGDTRTLIERDIELWNARDREGWLAAADLHRLEFQGPGGLRLLGQEAADTVWTTWNEAFPDNRLAITTIHTDDRGGAVEGRLTGTHTGTLRGPAGEIAATNQTVDTPFSSIYEIGDGKITSVHLFYDQMELLTQLGVAPGGGGSGA